MIGDPTLAIAVSARDWPDRLRRSLADHGGARVRLTALGPHDLDEDEFDVLIIDDISSFLTRGLVSRERSKGRVVVGVFDPAEPAGHAYLVDLGVDEIVESTAVADAFVTAARGRFSRAPARPAERAPVLERRGPVIRVTGATGGVGTSEIAYALARVLGGAALVELSARPSIAQRMGLSVHPNLMTALEVIDHGSGDVTPAIQQVGGVSVLVGVANPPAAADRAIQRLIEWVRAEAKWTIVELGDATNLPVREETQTVLVTAASPVGVVRCVDALRATDLTHTHVVFNRAPRGRFERGELFQAVLDEIRPRSVTILPDDPGVGGAAWNGRAVRTGPFVRAVGALANAVGGVR